SNSGRASQRWNPRGRFRQPQPGRTGLALDDESRREQRSRGGGEHVKVEGVKEFDAPAQTVWDVLMDPSRISKLLPGVESFEVQDDKHWSASVKVPLGMGGLKLKFKFEQVESRPIEYSKLNAGGHGVGAIVGMHPEFHLDPREGHRTTW